jgi:hypothetical protein
VATAGPSGSRTPPPPVDQRRDTDLGHSVEATRWQLQQHAWSLGTARLSEHRTRAGKWGESMRGSRTCFQRAAAPARRLPELLWHCGTNAVKRQRLGGQCKRERNQLAQRMRGERASGVARCRTACRSQGWALKFKARGRWWRRSSKRKWCTQG